MIFLAEQHPGGKAGCFQENLCDECRELAKKGIVLVSVDGESRRSGGWCVVTENAVRHWVTNDEAFEAILRKRQMTLPDKLWDKIGLPR